MNRKQAVRAMTLINNQATAKRGKAVSSILKGTPPNVWCENRIGVICRGKSWAGLVETLKRMARPLGI